MVSSHQTHLVSVTKTPARAALLVDQLLTNLHVEHDVLHVANSPTIHGLKPVLEALVRAPGILICSSQWTKEEQHEVNIIAKDLVFDIKIVNIPPGLDVREGGEGVVAFLQKAFEQFGVQDLKRATEDLEA